MGGGRVDVDQDAAAGRKGFHLTIREEKLATGPDMDEEGNVVMDKRKEEVKNWHQAQIAVRKSIMMGQVLEGMGFDLLKARQAGKEKYPDDSHVVADLKLSLEK